MKTKAKAKKIKRKKNYIIIHTLKLRKTT